MSNVSILSELLPRVVKLYPNLFAIGPKSNEESEEEQEFDENGEPVEEWFDEDGNPIKINN